MANWAQFVRSAPEMAAAGRELFYQHGVGLAYLATIRADGGPRLHPFCAIQVGDGLFGLIGESPKRSDLVRDGRFAIHSFPKPNCDDEFYLTGTAHRVVDHSAIEAARADMIANGAASSGDEWLFEFGLEHALLSTYEKLGSWPPEYTKWHDQ